MTPCPPATNHGTARALAVTLALVLLAGCSVLSDGLPASGPQEAGAQDGQEASRPAFDIRVECPDDELRELVERHNDLQRYRSIADLDRTELQRLAALTETDVRGLLATQGYFGPTVEVSTGVGENGRPAVTIAIAPGPRTTVGSVAIRFTGDIADSAEAAGQRQSIVDDWPLKEGRIFTQDDWSSAKNQALRQLVSTRYARGRIASSRADIDAATATAALTVELDSGPPYYLGPATVRGARRYPPDLAERLSWLEPGDVYDQKELVDAQQRLAASGYYDSAWISMDPQSDPNAARMRYSVNEAKQKKLRLGLGFRTDSGPRATVEHRNNAFLGTRWRADTTLQIEKKEPLLQMALTSLPNSGGWSRAALARYMRQDDGFLKTQSKTVTAGFIKTRKKYDHNVYLQLDHSRVTGSGSAAVPDALLGDGAAVALHYAWTGRYFDSMTMPTSGYGLKFDLGIGVTMIGEKRPFARLTGRWLGLMPLGKSGGRLQLNVETGMVIASQGARLPGSYMFRTGGDTTVRGYGYRRIGMPLGGGIVGPGRYMEVVSLEWQRPILQERMPGLLEHVLFLDMGSVSNRLRDFDAYWGVGTGIRAITPVGPMELDVAYGLKTRKARLHLSVGFTF